MLFNNVKNILKTYFLITIIYFSFFKYIFKIKNTKSIGVTENFCAKKISKLFPQQWPTKSILRCRLSHIRIVRHCWQCHKKSFKKYIKNLIVISDEFFRKPDKNRTTK